MDFIYLILFIAYVLYNGAQVIKSVNGIRYERPAVLFFFACFIDLFLFIKSKI